MLNKKNLKIFIIAGEVSGDVLGAKIMREMPNAEFFGVGGENMQSAGLKTIFPISDLAVMGFFEVLAHAKTLTTRIDETANAIIKSKPDVVLTVDAPGFAKRVIKKVRTKNPKSKIKFYHVVAPQVWAWGAKRAKKFAKIFDRLYCFFDFEVPFFTRYGLPTIAVGHPIADGLIQITKKKEKITKKDKNIALIPGSRMSEVKKLLPVFHSVVNQLTAKKKFTRYWDGIRFVENPIQFKIGTDSKEYENNGFKFVIPVTETTDKFIRNEIKNWAIKPQLISFQNRYKTFEKTDIAIAASGTVSAELAIMHIPTIVVYKMNPLTTFMARMALKIKWVSLVNILLNKTVYPELLGNKNATPEKIISEINKLSNPEIRNKMISDLKSADKMWRKSKMKTASRLIVKDIIKNFK
ncbi:MAG TPA: hypothetical protein PKJ33_02235 [Alphaproteobacteria bacterium]|nr:hypothetical protein [Alphaproteobacteria bacterium]